MSERLQIIRDWLRIDLKINFTALTPASEDASFRRYYRIFASDQTYIVMDAPPDKENCEPFLDVSQRLTNCGVNVPEVFAQDLEKGLLLLSDLGTELYLDALNESNADRLYADAIQALLKIQDKASTDNLAKYSGSLLRQEMALFPDWLLNKHLGIVLAGESLRQMDTLFSLLIDSALSQRQVFVHRDFHSRNLMLTENNPGIIDYQDAVLGPQSYDLVSLLKDCYIKWNQAKVEKWTRTYHARLVDSGKTQVSAEEFKRSFDLMGVQRHLKASGIFARLNHRDSKPGYLKDIPRTLSYIVDLKYDYPELETLVNLLEERVLPAM